MSRRLVVGLLCAGLVGCGEPASENGESGSNNGTTGNAESSNNADNGGDTNNSNDSPPTTRQSLVVEDDGVTLNGDLAMNTADVSSDEVSIGLRWNIEDGPFPSVTTTTTVEELEADGGLTFSTRTDVVPPPEALVPNESTGREGLAVAYVIAFIDGNANGALDCRNPGDCDDTFVGASPNTLVLYGDEEQLTDFSPLFTFDGAAGVVPETGWSLVHLTPNACEERPTAREWAESTDSVELVVIGDFLDKGRCERRAINPDVD